ncbi:sensor histidine kinase [Youxingia wuxianensis]|uniref:histidine kinase n=1 Tax=Youxingia wuxianensis TaxID=2763678 RepID=A0A926EJL2_9FIRM|nr:HAMP domain-containing sensor histidine kinase [Youxingia wuxianensis]MBC8584568.1 HAMP domain-containing histidine kinase [Youxingia wuxianensis]
MQKTLFSKYFALCSSIILLSITILGAVLLAFASQYFKQDKYRLLEYNAQKAVQLTYTDFRNNNFYYVDPKEILPSYSILADAIEADFYLVNTQGEMLLFAGASKSDYNEVNISESIINSAINQGEYQELGKMSGMYTTGHYTVGIPIVTELGQPAGVIFASTPATSLTEFLSEIFKMFIVSALAVLILSFVAIYFVTLGMVKPLRRMVKATQSFSKGDFTIRVPVESYDEIGQLAIAFNNMASDLASLESVRRSFTANVSHELRTPMTTIGGFIDGILDGTIPEEKRSFYLNIVSQEIKRLSRLVKSMLNIARIEAGEMQIKPDLFDVHDTVLQTVFTFETAIEGKHLEIRGLDHEKVMVEADPDLIHQVVYNLIENAVKFANDGGYLEFTYWDDDTSNYVGIKNSGDGISKDEIPHVFDRFYKTDKSRSQDKGGAGLGLHIVRSIINLHGGEIIVRSVENEYCEFVFTIPKPNGKAGSKALGGKNKKKEILLP